LAHCTNCGRELPSFTWGEQKNICPECERNPAQPEVVAAPSSGAPILIRRTWPITKALIVLNTLVYIAMVVRGVSPLSPTTGDLLRWGANWGPLSLDGQPWRMLTANYVHVGILHIGLNMWCLWNLGLLAEHVFDGWAYVLIYTICGIGGSIASLAWHPLVTGAGASGAVFGLAGALIAALYLGHMHARQALRGTIKSLVLFAVYNLAFGAAIPGIDNSAHIGGLVTGLALGALLAKHLTQPPDIRAAWQQKMFALAAVVLLAVFFLVQRTNGYVVTLGKGLQAYKAGQLDEAEKSFEVVGARQPDDRRILYLLASTYMQKKEYAKAIPVLEHLTQLDPHNGDAQLDLGSAHYQLGEFSQAIPYFEKAVQINPKDEDAQKALGEAQFQEQRKRQSVK
jgi:membrane associated rhomboid family serine protease